MSVHWDSFFDSVFAYKNCKSTAPQEYPPPNTESATRSPWSTRSRFCDKAIAQLGHPVLPYFLDVR